MKTQLCLPASLPSDAPIALRTLLNGLGAFGLVLSLVACGANSSDDSDAGGASEEEDCRRGEVWNGRRCVPVDDERDNGENPDDDVDAGPEDTLLPDGGLCDPGALECENATTVRSCNADGTEWVLQPCEEGLGCSSGQCVVGGNACEPGDVLGCASTTALRVCSSNGVDAEAQNCPAETPNCRSGACTAQICEPNSLSCNGNDVVQCNSDGNATNVLETCETACGDGVCIDPCEGNGKSYVGIVAVEEGTTTVNITPTANLQAGVSGTPAGINAGATGTYTLTRGQVLTLSTAVAEGLDLTGTSITADQNISVFWGSECSNVPLNVSYCDHMEEQLFPVDTWGLDFIGAKFAPRGTEPDLWRILASQDNTLIQTVPAIAGIDGRRINRGEFLEFSATADFVISASAPISVGQFMVSSSYPTPSGFCCAIPRTCSTGTGIGDPAFLIAVPESQFRSDYIVLTPATYQQDFLNIIAPSGAVITLDGSPIASPDARVGGWDIYRRRVEDGVHRLSGTAAFGLYAYGYDCDVSYAYPGGLNLDSL